LISLGRNANGPHNGHRTPTAPPLRLRLSIAAGRITSTALTDPKHAARQQARTILATSIHDSALVNADRELWRWTVPTPGPNGGVADSLDELQRRSAVAWDADG
jgi:hypothetical protein